MIWAVSLSTKDLRALSLSAFKRKNPIMSSINVKGAY